MAKPAPKPTQKATNQPANVLWYQIAEEKRQAAEAAKAAKAKEEKKKK